MRARIRWNLPEFPLLILINAFVGTMAGLERTVVPLIGEQDLGLPLTTTIVLLLVAFGITRALCNLFAGRFSERLGRKHILVLGWAAGLPVPLIIILANR